MLVMTGIMWSTGGLLIKSIPWPPLAISGIRGGIAALTIFLLIPDSKFTWSRIQITAAGCYVLVVTLFVIANKLTTAGNSILLQYTAPVYVAIFGYAFLGEKSTRVDWITILVLLTGLTLFFFDELTTSGVLKYMRYLFWNELCGSDSSAQETERSITCKFNSSRKPSNLIGRSACHRDRRDL